MKLKRGFSGADTELFFTTTNNNIVQQQHFIILHFKFGKTFFSHRTHCTMVCEYSMDVVFLYVKYDIFHNGIIKSGLLNQLQKSEMTLRKMNWQFTETNYRI